MRLNRLAERQRFLRRAAVPVGGAFLICGLLLAAVAQANHPARNGLIAFSSQRTCDELSDCTYSLETVGPSGKRRRRLACSETRIPRRFCTDALPRFSPDGRLLATGTSNVFDFDFIAVRPVGGSVRRTYSLRTSLADFAWAPSQRRIAFNEFGRIFFLNLAKGTVKPYRRTPGAEDVTWSRDGRLAWTKFSTGNLFVTDRARRQVRRIRVVGSKPRFSPHGTKIAYLGRNGAYVLRIRGRSKPRFIGRCETQETEVAWSPDGREIACHKDDPAGGLIAYNVRTKKRRTILRFGFPFSIDWQRRPSRSAQAWVRDRITKRPPSSKRPRREDKAGAFILRKSVLPLDDATPVTRLYYYNFADVYGFRHRDGQGPIGFTGRCRQIRRGEAPNVRKVPKCERDDSGFIGSEADDFESDTDEGWATTEKVKPIDESRPVRSVPSSVSFATATHARSSTARSDDAAESRS